MNDEPVLSNLLDSQVVHCKIRKRQPPLARRSTLIVT